MPLAYTFHLVLEEEFSFCATPRTRDSSSSLFSQPAIAQDPRLFYVSNKSVIETANKELGLDPKISVLSDGSCVVNWLARNASENRWRLHNLKNYYKQT